MPALQEQIPAGALPGGANAEDLIQQLISDEEQRQPAEGAAVQPIRNMGFEESEWAG